MLKKLVLFLLFIVLATPNFLMAESGHVVINAFQIAGNGGATDEFVELYNPTENPIRITGWRLSKKTATGSLSNLLTTFGERTLAPDEKLVIAHNNFKSNAEWRYSTASSIAADNTIVLFSDAGKTVVDKVGFGNSGDFEGEATLNPVVSEILFRDQGVDTDNNYEDFYSSTADSNTDEEGSEPDTGGGTDTPNSFYDLTITELMPNPKGSDADGEWIEIYNNGSRIDLGGLILRDKLGSPKQYRIPLGTFIESRGFAVFYSSKTPLSLNNDGDVVEIVDPYGKVLDSTEINFGKSQEGVAFALFGDTWRWTAKATPGAKNVLAAPKVTEKKKKAKATKKRKKKAGEVLGYVAEAQEEELGGIEDQISPAERKLGNGVILVAILIGTLYTLYVNREKIVETSKSLRSRYQNAWEKIRSKSPQ